MMLTLVLFAGQVPPIVSTAEARAEPALVSFAAGEVRCGGEVAQPVLAPVPMVAQSYTLAVPDPAPIVFGFTIDDRGRTLGIVQTSGARSVWSNNGDLAPALAAWRFAAGQPQKKCTLSFVPTVHPVRLAPIAMIHRAYSMPHAQGPAESALGARLRAEAASCVIPTPPLVRSRAFPHFERIPQAPSTSSYAMVGFDIDAKGRPRRVRILSSEGNTTLDTAAVKAVQDSRFGPSARTGCTFPYHRRQTAPLAAPAAVPADTFRTSGALCETKEPWTLPPRLVFPDAFRRRAIEGWAVIGYDVAPWGATGNVRILASEPAAAFGESAANVVRAARRPPSSIGATGCVERVVFKLSPRGAELPDAPEPPPPF